MDTLSETADKVDQSLQNMGIDGTSVKQSIRDFLDFKEYLAEQLPAFTGFCIKVVLSIIVFFVGRKIIKRELGGKWAVGVVIGQCVIAWLVAFVVYLVGGLFF